MSSDTDDPAPIDSENTASTLADQAESRLHPYEARQHTGVVTRDKPPARGHAGSLEAEEVEHGTSSAEWTEFARIGLVAVAAGLVWFRVWEPFPRLSVIGLSALVIGGWPIFREAVENLVARRMTMELSMTIALVAAAVIGEFFTALIIALFVLAAEILEGMTVERGRHAIEELLNYLPRTALVRRRGETLELPLTDLALGDAVLVNPGVKLPVDGTVIGGHSFIDQATITGESMPVERTVGDPVFAGTLNQSGALEIRAERLGRDTSFGKIIEAIERAEHSRAPVQRLADQLAGYLVYFAIGAAIVTFLVTRDARSTISVIIVAGACGIAAGTPLAILGAIGRAARQGAIIKGGRYLEALATVDTVAFDKTGTLTFGAPEVVEVRASIGIPETAVIENAAIAESRSEHSLAKAILREARSKGLSTVEPDRFVAAPGRGVVATLTSDEILVGSRDFIREHGVQTGWISDDSDSVPSTEIFVARRGRLLGAIRIADAIRPEAKRAVQALREMGIRTLLLTGDQEAVATGVGRAIGIDEIHAGLLPEDKVRRIEQLVQGGRRVAMVGDGINDAPALAAATIGVAMGSGTDVTRESADLVLIGNDLLKFVETLRLARRMRGIIMENFTGTLVVDAAGIGLAAFGFLNPLLAAFIHVTSELAFILNSTRLLPTPARK
ncbi:MAG TPA: cation-translocating P-type ATPase [Gemmatimonadaceae bacterium]